MWSVGSQFPNQGSNPPLCTGSTEFNHWTTREVPEQTGAAPNFFFTPSDMLCFDLGRYLTYIPISMMNKYGCDDSQSDSCTFSCCTVFFGEGGYFCVCVVKYTKDLPFQPFLSGPFRDIKHIY